MSNERETLAHDSYGMISFSRIQGRGRFFGSEIHANTYIELKIMSAEVQRENSSQS